MSHCEQIDYMVWREDEGVARIVGFLFCLLNINIIAGGTAAIESALEYSVVHPTDPTVISGWSLTFAFWYLTPVDLAYKLALFYPKTELS